jgi:hypothetical protein
MSLRAENTMYDTAYYNTAKQLYEYTQPQTNNNTSFYVTCLHELGHAIGIGHAEYYNQTQEPFDIHYFLQHNPGTLLPSQRRVLTSGYGQPIEAARKIIADSRKISWQINGGSSRSLGEIIPSTTCLVYDYNNAVSDTEKASVTKSSEPEQNVVYQWQFKNNTTFPNWTNIPIPAAGATTTFNKFGINSSNKNEVYLTGFSTYPQGTKLRCQTTVTPCDCEAGASSTVTSQEIAVIRKDTTFRLDFFTICITPSNQDSTFTINTGTPTGGTYEIEDCLGCVFNSNQFIPSKVGVGEWTLIYRANCQEYRLPRGLIIADDCLNVNGKSYFFDGLYQRKNTNHVQDMCLKPQSYKFKAHYSFMGNTPADVLSVFVSNPNGVFGGTAIVVGTKSIAAGSYLRGDISCSYTFPQTGTYKFRLFVPSSGGYAFDLYNNPNYGINVTISPDGLCPTLSLPVAKDGGQNADEPTLGITNGQETTVVVLDETVQKTAATAEQVIQRMVMIYPNPTRTGQVTVDFVDIMPTDVATVSIYDILGRKISEQVLSERNTLFDLGNQPSGTYILMLNVNGSVSGHKVVVQQ